MRALFLVISAVSLYWVIGHVSPNDIDRFSLAYYDINKNFGSLPGSIIGAFITALVAWIALRTHAAVNIRNKRMDVILHCNARYDELYKLRQDIEKGGKESQDHLTISYFRRYWGLQSDQIDYWLAGYVDPETMGSWVISLASSLKGKKVGGKSYQERWRSDASEVHRIVNKRLVETVDFCTDYLCHIDPPAQRYAAALQYLRIIEANESSLIRRLSRNSHRRMSVDDLSTTVTNEYWQEYNRFDVRIFPLRWINRSISSFIRWNDIAAEFIMANRVHRLERSIKRLFPFAGPSPKEARILDEDFK